LAVVARGITELLLNKQHNWAPRLSLSLLSSCFLSWKYDVYNSERNYDRGKKDVKKIIDLYCCPKLYAPFKIL